MDASLTPLCTALKRIIYSLKPHEHPLSLVLCIGHAHQGTSTLLKQSTLKQASVETAYPAELYYNAQGIFIDLSLEWFQTPKATHFLLKQLNRCHPRVKISGLILCVNIETLLLEDLQHRQQQYQNEALFIKQVLHALGTAVDLSLIITKIDLLTGCCDFFQYEHNNDLQQPLGFSIPADIQSFRQTFDLFIDALSQRVLDKIHPARGSLKRTLIREFPLQFASLGTLLQSFIYTLRQTAPTLSTVYFTSAQQGVCSIDRLHLKIQQDYALAMPHQHAQAVNYRAYFIEGALLAIQQRTIRETSRTVKHPYRWMTALVSIVGGSLLWMGQHTLQVFAQLDHAQQALKTYQTLSQKHRLTAAMTQLTAATTLVDQLPAFYPTTLTTLKHKLHGEQSNALRQYILPQLLTLLEKTLTDPQCTHSARYEALKIYVMLNQTTHFSTALLLNWVQQQAPHHPALKPTLLAQLFQTPLSHIPLNQQLISDTRNDLNALPIDYLYYQLAKTHFSTETTPLLVEGFRLPHTVIPVYLTKAGYIDTLKRLPDISQTLQAENWVLERQDLQQLPHLLKQAYSHDYVRWWEQFMQHTLPEPATQYTDLHQLTETLQRTHAIATLVYYLQQQTKPEMGPAYTYFNHAIASHFTTLNLMGPSPIRQLTRTLTELGQFVGTLSVVHDQGRTAFQFAKSRFLSDHFSHPLRSLYRHAEQLPAPVSTWAKQIADDTWAALLNDSRHYINHQWRETVYPEYMATIAHRYPFDHTTEQEITLEAFNHFFSPHGVLNRFIQDYLKVFIDTSTAQWELKQVNQYVLPISADMRNELIRANVITNMFFPLHRETSQIQFSLQKINLDPVIAHLHLLIGDTTLDDTQTSESLTRFTWPHENAKLSLRAIDGHHYALEETGPWAFFKLLQQVNVLVDDENAANLHILFEVNGNSGRYLLKTENEVNPFIPGILNEFILTDQIV